MDQSKSAKVAFMSLSPEGEQQDDCLYKSLLQELAQKKGLLLPVYATERTGPPHVPCFASSVQIAGDCYVGESARTKKQAEMNAAKIAYLALSKGGPRTNNAAAVSNFQTVGASNSRSPILQTAVTHIDEPIIIPPASKIQTTINDPNRYETFDIQEDDCLYKSLLQELAQKKGLLLPVYATERTGPPHVPCFASSVQIAGDCYVGESARTKKQAEMNSAKIAYLALSKGGPRTNNAAAVSNFQTVGASNSRSPILQTAVTHIDEPIIIPPASKIQTTINDPNRYETSDIQEDDCLYKSLLQELAQKKGLLLPVYATERTGPPHVPCFASSVQIAGDCYVGESARTKKQAEMNAAKIAYLALSKGGPRTNNAAAVSNFQTVGASNSRSPILQTAVTHIDEPIIIPPASKIQKTINDQALSIANEAEKGKGYQDLKNFQDVIEKHKNTMAPPVIHQSQPKATPHVVDLAKLSIRQEDVTHTTEGSGAHGKINQLPSAANGKITPLSSTANEMINQLSSTANERINQLSSTANEKINQLSPTEVTSDPVVGLDALRPCSIKIVIRSHVQGMKYDGAVQVSDEDWVAMKVNVYEET